MTEMEQLDRDLNGLKDGGVTVLEIRMSRARRRRLRGEIMAACGTTAVETDPAGSAQHVECYRNTPIVVVDGAEDDAVVYGLQA